jgi:hypothetical protein
MELANNINLNLYDFKGFSIVKNDDSIEAKKLRVYCIIKDIPLDIVSKGIKCKDDFVPCGTIQWCQMSLKKITPDYYPEWCNDLLYRKVWKDDNWIIGRKSFVKPADTYKRFNGFITDGTYKKKKKGNLIWSELLYFKDEYRYYISKGNILTYGWYMGNEENHLEHLNLPIEIPEYYYGALDIGLTIDNRIALIESQHPFACGWYGKDDEKYFQWLIDGWKYMLENYKLN